MRLLRANRDLRVDLFRGLALWWIFVDHIPGDWLGDLSLRNFALCDATEVFVLLAGYGAGLAYGSVMDRHGWLFAGADVVRRAWTLYVAHIFLFVVFSAQVAYSATAMDRADFIEEIHLDVMAEAPYRALFEALTLRFQPAYLNILPLYVVLLGLFAAALPMLRRPTVLCCLSFIMYVVARTVPVNLTSWTGGGWYFNPLTWQLLFVIGAVLAYAPARLPRRAGMVDGAAVLVAALGPVVIYGLWPHPEWLARVPWLSHAIFSIDKTGLHPFRLTSILAFLWLVVRLVPRDAPWLRSWAAKPFELIGQHSLPVFCFGIFAAFLGRLVMEIEDGFLAQVGVNVLGAGSLVAIGALAAWYREKGRESARPPASVAREAVETV